MLDADFSVALADSPSVFLKLFFFKSETSSEVQNVSKQNLNLRTRRKPGQGPSFPLEASEQIQFSLQKMYTSWESGR